MSRSKTKTQHAQELCKRFPDTPSRTLARRFVEEWGGTLEAARALIRLARGVFGERRRHRKVVDKEKGKAGWVPKKPPTSLAENWEPFLLDGVKNVGIISDLHIPWHSEKALELAVKTLRADKIDCLLINGDYADFYEMSRWQKNPKKRDFAVERTLMREGLEWLRDCFPKARMVFKKGNHEERWDHWLWNNAPVISDMECLLMQDWLDFESLSIEMVEDQRPIIYSGLPIMHGHELGKSIFSPVNPARGAYLRTKHCCLVGHSHATSAHSDPDMFHSETFVWSVGCLCHLNPEYARINRWNHGFARVSGTGSEYSVNNYRIGKNWHVRSS